MDVSTGASRRAFRDALRLDDATWARARGWALWKAVLCLTQDLGVDAQAAAADRAVIDAVLAEHAD